MTSTGYNDGDSNGSPASSYNEPMASTSTQPIPVPKAKRKRITPEQQEVLNKLFETTDTPNLETRERLSKEIGMTPREIQVYYQNQRAKRRRLAKQASIPPNAVAGPSSQPIPHDPYPPAPYAAHPYAVPGPSAFLAAPDRVALPHRRRSLDTHPYYVSRPPSHPYASSSSSISTNPSSVQTPSPALVGGSGGGGGGMRLPPLREVFSDLFPALPRYPSPPLTTTMTTTTTTSAPAAYVTASSPRRPQLAHAPASFPPPMGRGASSGESGSEGWRGG